MSNPLIDSRSLPIQTIDFTVVNNNYQEHVVPPSELPRSTQIHLVSIDHRHVEDQNLNDL